MECQEAETRTEVPFACVGGHKEIISELRRQIEIPYQFPDVKKRSIGILMYGPPGCGKTLIARELAKQFGDCFFKVIQGPELMSRYVGQAENDLRKAFADCQKESYERKLPSFLFLDEADAVLPSRDRTDTQFEIRYVNQFLSLMDGFSQRQDVIVIGATNRPHVIDLAAKRNGRFGQEVYIGPPSHEERIEILNIYKNEYEQSVKIDSSINDKYLSEISKLLEQYNGSDIQAIFQTAYELCKRRSFQLNSQNRFEKVCELEILPIDLDNSIKKYVPHFQRANAQNYESYYQSLK